MAYSVQFVTCNKNGKFVSFPWPKNLNFKARGYLITTYLLMSLITGRSSKTIQWHVGAR